MKSCRAVIVTRWALQVSDETHDLVNRDGLRLRASPKVSKWLSSMDGAEDWACKRTSGSYFLDWR